MNGDNRLLKYSILDPTGNITALVESRVEISRQPFVAAKIQQLHPEVEQVGFVMRPGTDCPERNVDFVLRMAGGEFCGNATMSAAALYLLRYGNAGGDDELAGVRENQKGNAKNVLLRVSGASEPVEVRLQTVESPLNVAEARPPVVDSSAITSAVSDIAGHDTAGGIAPGFRAGVHMPRALGIDMPEFAFEDTDAGAEGQLPNMGGQLSDEGKQFPRLDGRLPLVRMEGISHLIIRPDSPFYVLRAKPEAAERIVREWCSLLSADGLGLMFLEPLSAHGSDVTELLQDGQCASGLSHGRQDAPGASFGRQGDIGRETDERESSVRNAYRLTPLVYVPGSETVYWEHSCASGSSAVGMYLAWQLGSRGKAVTNRSEGSFAANGELTGGCAANDGRAGGCDTYDGLADGYKDAPMTFILHEPGGILRVTSSPADGDTWLYGTVRLLSTDFI